MRRIILSLFLLLAVLLPASAQTITPQGRLTLTAGTPVMAADATAQSTVYLDCYNGNVEPVAGVNLTIGACEISMGLSTSHAISGSVYDIFAINNAGTLAMCIGPAWTSTTARGTGAGTTEIHRDANGLLTNTNALTNCWGGGGGTTDFGTVAVDAGTYRGSFYATANGQTGMQFAPARASGGTNNILGLYNAYNRVPVFSFAGDSTSSWTYGSATWRGANNSASNRITWLDGLKQSNVSASYGITINSPTSTNGSVGINFDSTSATPGGVVGYNCCVTEQSVRGGNSTILLGLHYAQAMEAQLDGSGNITFFNQVFTGQWSGGLILGMMN